VLGDVTVRGAWGGEIPEFDQLMRRDWELFLHTIASSFSLYGAPVELSYWRESTTQEDCMRMGRAAAASDISALLPALAVPTLIINTRRLREDSPVTALAKQGQAIATAIPDARLILLDGFARCWYSTGTEPPQAVQLIEDFLRGLPEADRSPWPAAPGLSSRQREVLELLAEGKTNREIAEELVLSERTVQRHVADIYARIGARNRAEATAFVHRRAVG
jgi:DNA-binding CsgD family transcriptional regulator